jgi:hypothetical protein
VVAIFSESRTRPSRVAAMLLSGLIIIVAFANLYLLASIRPPIEIKMGIYSFNSAILFMFIFMLIFTFTITLSILYIQAERKLGINSQASKALFQIVMFLGVFIGVLLSESILAASKTGAFEMPQLNPSVIILKSVVTLLIVPIVYREVKEEEIFLVRFGIYVQNGVFWSVILTSISKGFGYF